VFGPVVKTYRTSTIYFTKNADPRKQWFSLNALFLFSVERVAWPSFWFSTLPLECQKNDSAGNAERTKIHCNIISRKYTESTPSFATERWSQILRPGPTSCLSSC
jgi:hypothetical protein